MAEVANGDKAKGEEIIVILSLIITGIVVIATITGIILIIVKKRGSPKREIYKNK